MKEKRTPNSRISVRFKSLVPAKKIKSKKGFTLVELVVVIAIIAILAAIAIPIVASTTASSIVSRAKTNANTIECAFKEADAAVAMGNNAMYDKASVNKIQISDVVKQNSLTYAMQPENIFGTVYYPVFCNGKVYFAYDSNNDGVIDKNDKDLDDNILSGDVVVLYDKNKGGIIDGNISILNISNR